MSNKANVKDVIEAIEAKASKRYPFAQVISKPIAKNNTKKTGITIRNVLDASNISPCLYVEDYIISGMSADGIAERILDLFEAVNANKPTFDTDFTDWDSIKNNIFITVVGTEGNEEFLKDKVSVPIMDMSIVFRIRVDVPEPVKTATVAITNQMAEAYGKCLDDICTAALKSPMTDDYEVIPMSDLLREKWGDEFDEEYFLCTPPMYILTNSYRLFGAGQIANFKALDALAEIVGSDYFILPSSVHECIAISMDGIDPRGLRELVGTVNDESGTVPPEERLSYSVYAYETGNDGKRHLIIAA